MELLENGWVLIAHSGCIVLAMSNEGIADREYAVWRIGTSGGTFDGSYFSAVTEAVACYIDRLVATNSAPPQTPKLKGG